MSTVLKSSQPVTRNSQEVSGEFINFVGDERFYAIRNADQMAPFFISVVSDSDHWMFISSNGGLTAGRVSPETALFPYLSVDKIHESSAHTGSKTVLRVQTESGVRGWEPFNREHDGRYQINRHLYKNLLGNKLCFEEINEDLKLIFRYSWMSSDYFGFVRHCEIQNLSNQPVKLDFIDGLQNILPAGTPRLLQSSSSNLIDAYKWSELDESSGLALFTLNSGITDKPEPCESLKANTVFCLGLENPRYLISSLQLGDFRNGKPLQQESHKRGIRGAYLVNDSITLEPEGSHDWQMVANTEQTQTQVVALRQRLHDTKSVKQSITKSIESGSEQLAKIMASADGFQLVREEKVAVHHYANVLFNIQRGGGFVDQYRVSSSDFSKTVNHFNHDVFKRNREFIEQLPATLNFAELLVLVQEQNDTSLERLCYEYLPISFGRRHGDPSRPWNQFSIKLKDEEGNQLLSYQGNWRDIFQNWEALALSYPDFVENMIAKFVNASTVDGYNPYRITKQGIDWEIEDEDDPWSYIGYWGDHQIIYLLKLLEQSHAFHPDRLGQLLHKPIFCYANVPYRIKGFDKLISNAKDTVIFDQSMADQIERRVAKMGADGKLVLESGGRVYQVNLLEKLLVALLCKLGNLVVDGGIWLNTQRPEWNDANNALVGQGLSMVTLYYLRRYICFLQDLLKDETQSVSLSNEVALWLSQTSESLIRLQPYLTETQLSHSQRYRFLEELGNAACQYRHSIYNTQCFTGRVDTSIGSVQELLVVALAAIDHSISHNYGDDGLYQAYNLMDLRGKEVAINQLYPMLEGQVAALSTGAIQPERAVSVLEALFSSNLFRADQESFVLYPDRQLPGFLKKNRIPDVLVQGIPLAGQMFEAGDESVVLKDVDGCYRFNAEISNHGVLSARLDALSDVYGQENVNLSRDVFTKLYETVFNHQAFTGRSGGMFGFEGLGSIYWHMVSKLLLVVQENYFSALKQNADKKVCQQLGGLYYRVRQGIGFNKTPLEYGAFPTDPYSHTPKHAGARQPGMTGQVKEEVLSRFGELGVRINNGQVSFSPSLLRSCEFLDQDLPFRYLDVFNQWQSLDVPRNALAFTWCQLPVLYQLHEKQSQPKLTILWRDGQSESFMQSHLDTAQSAELFKRSGKIKQLIFEFNQQSLFV